MDTRTIIGFIVILLGFVIVYVGYRISSDSTMPQTSTILTDPDYLANEQIRKRQDIIFDKMSALMHKRHVLFMDGLKGEINQRDLTNNDTIDAQIAALNQERVNLYSEQKKHLARLKVRY